MNRIHISCTYGINCLVLCRCCAHPLSATATHRTRWIEHYKSHSRFSIEFISSTRFSQKKKSSAESGIFARARNSESFQMTDFFCLDITAPRKIMDLWGALIMRRRSIWNSYYYALNRMPSTHVFLFIWQERSVCVFFAFVSCKMLNHATLSLVSVLFCSLSLSLSSVKIILPKKQRAAMERCGNTTPSHSNVVRAAVCLQLRCSSCSISWVLFTISSHQISPYSQNQCGGFCSRLAQLSSSSSLYSVYSAHSQSQIDAAAFIVLNYFSWVCVCMYLLLVHCDVRCFVVPQSSKNLMRCGSNRDRACNRSHALISHD